MKVYEGNVSFDTKGFCDIVEVTSGIQRVIEESQIRSGIMCISCAGATGGLTTVEYEPGLVADLKALFERLAPEDIEYEHHRYHLDGNGPGHVRASLLGPSLTLPVREGRLVLGRWQQVVFIDFDNRPRHRELVVQVLGE